MTRVMDAVLAKLKGAKRKGDGWLARCPAHDDKSPSLSIGEGDDGRVLLRCFANCSTDAICGAMGIKTSDLFTKNNGSPRPPRRSPPPLPPITFPTADKAVEHLERQLGKRAASWTYHDSEGEPVGLAVRWDKPNGEKEIRPVSKHGDRWQCKGMPTPRPLYRLPELSEAQTVYVVEGEKTADALTGLGLVVTASAHGSNAAKETDWKPLAGKTCIILPDNDKPGQRYADDVVGLLAKLSPSPTIKVVALPGLPDKGDAVDYIQARRDAGADDDVIRGEIEALADDAEAVKPEAKAPPVLQWKPFPTASLPEPLRGFVASVAVATGCDESLVALSILAVVASCIGNTRRITIKRGKSGWSEPPLVWLCVVMKSGGKKSPAFRPVLRPLKEIHHRLHEEYIEALEKYDAKVEELKSKPKGKGVVLPAKLKPPTAERVLVGDTTFEALASVLQENWRGVLLHCDELALWFKTFDVYRGGKGGDCQKWISIFDCELIVIDRKGGVPRTTNVPQPYVSISGTIQPGTLARVLTSENQENGLAARFLFAQPPCRMQKWTDAEVPESVETAFEDVVHRLRKLTPHEDKAGRPYPVSLPLSPEAKALFVSFLNRCEEEWSNLDGAMAAAIRKIVAYAARFALIFQCVRGAAGTASLDVVDETSMKSGIVLADWFKGEAERLYAAFSETPEDVESRHLLEWIQGRGGSVSVHDLTHGLRRYRNQPDAAQAALDDLDAKGLGTWIDPSPSGKGGRPSRRFQLVPTVTVTETPRDDTAKGGNGDGDTGDTPENTLPGPGDDGQDEPTIEPDDDDAEGI